MLSVCLCYGYLLYVYVYMYSTRKIHGWCEVQFIFLVILFIISWFVHFYDSAKLLVCWLRFFYFPFLHKHTHRDSLICFVFYFVRLGAIGFSHTYFCIHTAMIDHKLSAYLVCICCAYKNVDCFWRIDICPSKIWF